jgi:hypothetical protein
MARMSNAAKATIDTVDWSFVDNEPLMFQFALAEKRIRATYQSSVVDDAKQEALLYFATLASIKTYIVDEESRKNFGLRAYKKMAERCVTALKYHDRLEQGW